MISVVNIHIYPDISNWDTSSVLDMRGMFYNAESFNRPISNWDTSSMINWNDNRIYNEPIGNWDIL
jgi:surface protein